MRTSTFVGIPVGPFEGREAIAPGLPRAAARRRDRRPRRSTSPTARPSSAATRWRRERRHRDDDAAPTAATTITGADRGLRPGRPRPRRRSTRPSSGATSRSSTRRSTATRWSTSTRRRSSQKPQRRHRRGRRLLPRVQRQRPPRDLHDRREGDRGLREGPGQGRPVHQRPGQPRGHLHPQRDRGDQPRRLLVGPPEHRRAATRSS